MKEHPQSPFLWKNDKSPTIFALDPHFKSKQKAGLLENEEGLGYKQFGTRHLSQIPTPNIHASPNEYNPGDRLFVRRKTKERND